MIGRLGTNAKLAPQSFLMAPAHAEWRVASSRARAVKPMQTHNLSHQGRRLSESVQSRSKLPVTVSPPVDDPAHAKAP